MSLVQKRKAGTHNALKDICLFSGAKQKSDDGYFPQEMAGGLGVVLQLWEVNLLSGGQSHMVLTEQ
eukprot:10285566-Karenia_brevis.AAC.1